MISEKFSTNPESFIKFERGRRIDLAASHGYPYILSLLAHFSLSSIFSLHPPNNKNKA
jgi:hypothetical protein